MRKRFKIFIRRFIQDMITMAITVPAGNWAVRYAYENRGYPAIGGEHLFIPVVFLVVYIGCGWLMETLEEIRWHKNQEPQLTKAEHEKKGATDQC